MSLGKERRKLTKSNKLESRDKGNFDKQRRKPSMLQEPLIFYKNLGLNMDNVDKEIMWINMVNK